MTIEELFRRLSYNELSNLALAVDAIGAIKKDSQNQILSVINDGLTRLHSKYILRTSLQIVTRTGEDMEIPLDPEVIQVLSAITAYGESFTVHRYPRPGHYYMHEGVLHLPAGRVGTLVELTYQLRHPELTEIRTPEDLNQEVHLIPELLPALAAHVAWQMYSNINTPEAARASMSYDLRFNQVCQEAKERGLVLEDVTLPEQRFEQRGWI